MKCKKRYVISVILLTLSFTLSHTALALDPAEDQTEQGVDAGENAVQDAEKYASNGAEGEKLAQKDDAAAPDLGKVDEKVDEKIKDAERKEIASEKFSQQKAKNEKMRLQLEVVPGNDNHSPSAPSKKIDGKWIPLGLTTSYELTSNGTIINNLDFRKIADPQAPFLDIQNSDDKTIFATTRIAAGLKYKPIEAIETAVSLSHTGHWGNHNISSKKVLGGLLSVERLFVKWNIWEGENFSISTTVGRQGFAIGSFSDEKGVLRGNKIRNYLMAGTIDGITLDVDFGDYGALKLMPLDIFSVGARPHSVPVAAKEKSSGAMKFDGSNFTIRAGGIYENTKLINGLALRGFFFFADIGAGASGSDRTYQGATGNAIDNDYNWMTGIRINYTLPLNDLFALGFGGEYARSGGIDRKAVQAGYYDVDTIGNAYGASIIGALDLKSVKLVIPVQFFRADGGKYTANDGLPYSHGFASFRGSGIGGLLMNNGLGWKPSAYVDEGVSHRVYDKYRASGSMILSAGIESSFFDDTFGLDLNVWYVADTSSSAFKQEDIDKASSKPAFGFTRADLEAQRRLGLPLATEIDLEISYLPYDILTLYAVGGVLLPDDGFKIEIDRVVGSALGSSNPVLGWGVTLGMTLAL